MSHDGKVRWGVLGAAKIARDLVVPAMQQSAWSQVIAIASRDVARARSAAAALGVPAAYGSYEELLADPAIEAVYIPLPNHLHVPWTIRAAEAGKHVLCEKPIGLNAADAERLLAVRDRTGVRIQEAFMIRNHPQWIAAVDLARSGQLGDLRAIVGCFSHHSSSAENIRNVPEFGGGGLMDLGCYLIHTARWIMGREPDRVSGVLENDPRFGVDRLASFVLDFGGAQAIGMCSRQAAGFQRVEILGAHQRVEVEIAFNAPSDRRCRIVVDSGSDLFGGGARTIEFDVCNQYTLQGDVFSRAIREGTEQALPLEDSINNMRVLDAVVRSARSGAWETLHR